MKSVEGIRQRCRDANDPLFYDRMYVLQVSTAGYSEWIDSGVGNLCRSWSRQIGLGKADIPDYPMIDPGESIRGVTNHMLINDRIAVASVVLTLPEIHADVSDLTEREIVEKWFEDSWINGEWATEVEMAGMDYRSSSIGWMVCGPSDGTGSDQTTMWIHVDPLDMLFDRAYKSPGRWRWFCYRERLPLDDAVERFGHIFNQDIASGGRAERDKLAKDHNIPHTLAAIVPESPLSDTEIYEKIKSLCVRRVDPLNRSWMDIATRGNMAQDANINDYVLHVWHYWDKDHHVAFIGSIDGGKSIPVTYRQMAGADSGWNYQIASEAGPNPYGILPCSWWLGNWASGMLRPTPTSELVKPLSDMLRNLDALMVTTIKRSIPMIVVNNGSLDSEATEFRQQWDKAVQGNSPMEFLEMSYGVDLKEAIQRLDMGGFKPEWLEFRQLIKMELDAATGITGPYRGEGMAGGEKTRKEATALLHAADTQQRDMRNKYCDLLKSMVKVSMVVGSQVDSRPRILQLDDGPVQINGQGFPISQFISKPCPIFIDPKDMAFRAKEEVQAEALAQWKESQAGIQLGLVHPRRAMEDFLAKFGGKKAVKLLYTDKEMADNQKSKAQQAQTQAVQQLISQIKIELAELPDQIKQSIFEASGLVPKGTPVDWGPNAESKFEAQVELGKHAADIEHEQRLASQEHISSAAEQGRDHKHELQKQAEAPKPVAAGKPAAKK